jgi:hypothetical protein
MVAIAIAPLIPLIGRLGIAGTKTFLKSPMGKKILDSLVGGGATAYGLERTGVADTLFNLADLPEGVTTGSELEKESKEDREKKKEERKKTLADVKGSRAAGMRGDELDDAIERGDFDAYINRFMTPDPDAGKPTILKGPEIGAESPIPLVTPPMGVPGIDEIIKQPVGGGFGAGLPETTKEDSIIGGGFTKTDIPDMSILTMAKIKDKDLVYVGGDINAKLPKYFVDESGKLKPEYQKKGNEGEDADKLIDVRAGYKLPKYMLNEIKFTRTKNKGKPNEKVVQDTKYTIKDEYKNPEELKRLQDSQKLKDLMTGYFEQNPSSYDILYKSNQSGKKELEQIQKFFKENYNIDFDVDTYEKIISQTYGSREKEGVSRGAEKVAIDKFKKIINDYSKEKFGESLTTPEMDRYIQEFRIGLKVENPDRVRGEEYTDEQVASTSNLIIDTVFKGKYREKFDIGFDRDLVPYVENKLKRIAENEKMFADAKAAGASEEELAEIKSKNIVTIGHYGTRRDNIVGEGGDLTLAVDQSKEKNTLQDKLDREYREARANNDIKKMIEIENTMKENDIRSMYTDEDGFRVFIGADAQKGKMRDGGMVSINKMTSSLSGKY